MGGSPFVALQSHLKRGYQKKTPTPIVVFFFSRFFPIKKQKSRRCFFCSPGFSSFPPAPAAPGPGPRPATSPSPLSARSARSPLGLASHVEELEASNYQLLFWCFSTLCLFSDFFFSVVCFSMGKPGPRKGREGQLFGRLF